MYSSYIVNIYVPIVKVVTWRPNLLILMRSARHDSHSLLALLVLLLMLLLLLGGALETTYLAKTTIALFSKYELPKKELA